MGEKVVPIMTIENAVIQVSITMVSVLPTVTIFKM